MLDRKSSSWFYPKTTGDPGRDRNVRTLQFSCFLLAFAVGAVLIVSAIDREWQQAPLLVFAMAGLVAAVVMNRAGRSDWAGRTAFLIVLLSAIVLVFRAHDGFRSHSMLLFPGLLLISVMMLDRASYVTTAGIVVVAVAALGIAVKHGLTRATPPVRTTYDSIFYVDLNLLVIAIIGSRIARDAQTNISDLRASNSRLSAANVELTESAEALRRNERIYRAIGESLDYGLWVCAPDGRNIYASESLLKLVGHTQEQCSSFGWGDVLHPDDRERTLAAWKECVRTGGTLDIEHRFRGADGEWHPVLARGVPVREEEGRITCWAGINLDIGGLKRVEDALRDSEETFRATFMNSADALLIVTLEEGTIVDVNEAFETLYGYTRQEAVGKTSLQLHLYSQPADRTRALAEVRAKRQLREYEAVARKKSGEEFNAALSTNTFMLGGKWHLAAAVRDITARKLAEKALRESEERFRNMADGAPVIIFLNDAAGKMTFLNKQATAFSGLTVERLTGYGWVELLDPNDRERVMSSHWATVKDPVFGQLELRLRRTDGQYRWMLVTASPRFVDGEFAGYIGTMIDITDPKRNQEQAVATQKLESLGVLAGGIAHDFNNLLGSIVANSELVLSELPGGSPAAEGIGSIRNVAHRAAEIVGQMMVYAGQEDTAFEPVDLSELLHEMLEFLKVSISKRATLNVTLPEKLPSVRGNAAQLRQVVLNLITNASEALGEQEGVISVTMSQVQTGPSDSMPNLPRGDYVRLEVSDTGCGMTEEIQSKIFDPFFTTKFPGRGMGLAAVKGIVRSHGGAINVVSVPGQGSRFEILLPFNSEPGREGHGDAVSSSAASEVASVAGTVLLVEDEDTLRLAVSKMLQRKGLTVIEAADGKTGVDLFRASPTEIDVVLLDLTLPGMSGREVLSELRRVKPNVKVIITTAYSQEWAQATLGGQQPWLYIRKPYHLDELTGLLRKSIWTNGG